MTPTQVVLQVAANHSASRGGRCGGPPAIRLDQVALVIGMWLAVAFVVWIVCVWVDAWKNDTYNRSFNRGIMSLLWPAAVPVMGIAWLLGPIRKSLLRLREYLRDQRREKTPDRGAEPYRSRKSD